MLYLIFMIDSMEYFSHLDKNKDNWFSVLFTNSIDFMLKYFCNIFLLIQFLISTLTSSLHIKLHLICNDLFFYFMISSFTYLVLYFHIPIHFFFVVKSFGNNIFRLFYSVKEFTPFIVSKYENKTHQKSFFIFFQLLC